MFEFFFKYPPEVFSKASFVLLGSWPRWLLVLLILIATGALAYNLSGGLRRRPAATFGGVANSTATRWRTAGLWILQTALASLILLLLWQPALSIAALKPQQNIVALVVDDSRSMSVADSGTERIETAKRVLKDSLINDLNKRFQVRLYRLDAALTRMSSKDADSLTATAPATTAYRDRLSMSASAMRRKPRSAARDSDTSSRARFRGLILAVEFSNRLCRASTAEHPQRRRRVNRGRLPLPHSYCRPTSLLGQLY